VRAPAPAKINLALVVGPPRYDGKHEVLTALQRIDLVDRIERAQPRVDAFVVAADQHEPIELGPGGGVGELKSHAALVMTKCRVWALIGSQGCVSGPRPSDRRVSLNVLVSLPNSRSVIVFIALRPLLLE